MSHIFSSAEVWLQTRNKVLVMGETLTGRHIRFRCLWLGKDVWVVSRLRLSLSILVEVKLDVLILSLLWQSRRVDSRVSGSLFRNCPWIRAQSPNRRHRFIFVHFLETVQPILRKTTSTALTKVTYFRFVIGVSIHRWRDLRIGKLTAISCCVLIGT